MDTKEINWGLLAKHFSGETTEEENRELRKWVEADEANRTEYEKLALSWGAAAPGVHGNAPDVGQAWEKLKKRFPVPGSKPERYIHRAFRMNHLYRLAAMLVIAVGISYLIFRLATGSNGAEVMMYADTGQGEFKEIMLPDSTTVWLNSRSSIKYMDPARTGERQVILDGEAYFDVRHNPLMPFLIAAGEGVIRVTGTGFSVNTKAAGDQVEVFVESGRVQFYHRKNTAEMVILDPGSIAVLGNEKISSGKNMDENYLSWKTRKLVFKSTEMSRVIPVLEKTYQISLLTENDDLLDCRLTATFFNQPVDSVIQVISTTFNLEYQNRNGEILLSGTGCN